MIEVQRTDVFVAWLDNLRDNQAVARIAKRIKRIELGNPGDVKSVGCGVSELRIDYGPGYRLYFTKRGKAIVLLLCGGDKRTQDRDIKLAIDMAKELD
jgi:putative addiction module killer protein